MLCLFSIEPSLLVLECGLHCASCSKLWYLSLNNSVICSSHAYSRKNILQRVSINIWAIIYLFLPFTRPVVLYQRTEDWSFWIQAKINWLYHGFVPCQLICSEEKITMYNLITLNSLFSFSNSFVYEKKNKTVYNISFNTGWQYLVLIPRTTNPQMTRRTHISNIW